jgi:putative ABC transport system permease protein
MALGATKKHIVSHYLFESLIATVIGGAIGMIITIISIYLIRLIPMQSKIIESLGKPKPVLSLSVLAIVIVVLGIIGFVAGLFPALKAAKIDPAEALIYE